MHWKIGSANMTETKVSLVWKKPSQPANRTAYPYHFITKAVIPLNKEQVKNLIDQDKKFMKEIRNMLLEKHVPEGSEILVSMSIGNYGGHLGYMLLRNRWHTYQKRLGMKTDRQVGWKILTRFIL